MSQLPPRLPLPPWLTAKGLGIVQKQLGRRAHDKDDVLLLWRKIVIEAITGRTRADAAKLLGVSTTTLWLWLTIAWNVSPETFGIMEDADRVAKVRGPRPPPPLAPWSTHTARSLFARSGVAASSASPSSASLPSSAIPPLSPSATKEQWFTLVLAAITRAVAHAHVLRVADSLPPSPTVAIDLAHLARDLGISTRTAYRWMELLADDPELVARLPQGLRLPTRRVKADSQCVTPDAP